MRLLRLFCTGLCMGTADIIPGVSGGTMAFILGIYDELVDSIRSFTTATFWSPLLHGNVKKAWEVSNWKFLIPLGAGILSAILTLSHMIEWLLEQHAVFVWSFFFGLVLSSAFIVSRRIRQFRPYAVVTLMLGSMFGYTAVGMVPMQTPDDPWFIVFSGAVAICAMILPGISGSFLLVILGKYEFILHAVNSRDLLTLLYFILGIIGGILSFSRLLSWLLHHYHDLMVAFLTGLMIGSLRKIWPWQFDGHNVLPTLGHDWVTGVSLMLVGCIVVFILEKIADTK